MKYRVEELALAAGVSVDTIRFYQSRQLLPAPSRDGRIAYYSAEHLERIQQIRSLNRQGLTLDGVRRVLTDLDTDGDGGEVRASLLGALAEAEGERTYDRAELAAASAVPEMLIAQAEQAGLLQPLLVDGRERYTESDRRAAEAARGLLEAGLPLVELVALAQSHAAHVEQVVDRAVELFYSYVRQLGPDGARRPTEEVTEAFRELLPAATTLVALHFQRTLIQRSRRRLAESGDNPELEAAIAASESSRLKMTWG